MVAPRLIALIPTVLLGILTNYLALPAMNLQSYGLLWFILIFLAIYLIFDAIFVWIADDELSIFEKGVGIVAAFVLIFILVASFFSSKLINWQRYQSMIEIEEHDEADFASDVASSTNIANLAVVDVETARNVGDRTLANIRNPSWYEVDPEYNLILYQGKQYRISPVNYGGIFKYFSASSTGLPGYVLVDAVTQEAQLVQLEEPVRYSPSALFEYDLRRHLRNQYPSAIFGKSFFEIDEEGNPYWITSVQNPHIGLLGGMMEDSFIITDACTGASTEYTVENLPEWVDHAFDLDYLMRLIENNHSLVRGLFNFSNTDVYHTSYQYRSYSEEDGYFAGYNTTLSKDGIVFFSGVTPANNSESIIGFILANPRTGVVKFYSSVGAEESSTQAAVEGLVSDLKYTATYPTIINVEGKPTYFMTLKDNAGLIQRYALCNVANYSIAVQAPTVEEALSLYFERIGVSTETTEEPQEVKKETYTTSGVISFLSQVAVDGTTYYCIQLEGDSNLYMSSIKLNPMQVLMTVSSTVNIEYQETETEAVYLVTNIEL